MKNSFRILTGGLLTGLLVVFMTACGGGGGGSTLTPENSEATTKGVELGISIAMDSMGLSGFTTEGTISYSVTGLIRQTVSGIKANSFSAQEVYTIPCNSGSMTFDYGMADTVINITFDNCTIEDTYRHGTMTLEFFYDTNFDDLMITTEIMIQADMTLRIDAENIDITYDNFVMDITDIQYSGYELTQATLEVDGNVTGTLEDDTVDIGFDSFVVEFSISGGYLYISISGSLYEGQCVQGWLTLTTLQSIKIAEDAECPIEGIVEATAGSDTTRIEFLSDGGANVYVNSALVETYQSCEDIEAVCTEG